MNDQSEYANPKYESKGLVKYTPITSLLQILDT